LIRSKHADDSEIGCRCPRFLPGFELERAFGSSHARVTEVVPLAARLVLDCIGNSDALYHNVEHTMLVALAGHDILAGRALLVPTSPEDYAHLVVACLMHDIGYVRGVLDADESGYIVDQTGRKVSLPRGSSDASPVTIPCGTLKALCA
jgi:hypothetical protein